MCSHPSYVTLFLHQCLSCHCRSYSRYFQCVSSIPPSFDSGRFTKAALRTHFDEEPLTEHDDDVMNMRATGASVAEQSTSSTAGPDEVIAPGNASTGGNIGSINEGPHDDNDEDDDGMLCLHSILALYSDCRRERRSTGARH